MSKLQNINSTGLGLPQDSYIYNIVSTAPQLEPHQFGKTERLAVISSDNSLRLIDATSLAPLPDGVFQSVNESVTCLKRVSMDGNVLATCGRDGKINCWDVRTKKAALKINTPKNLPLSALAWSPLANAIAAGVEHEENGLGETPVFVWDMRNSSKPQLELLDSHTDTVAELQFHPTYKNILLSGSTDNLVNIFAIDQPNEEDALHQIINNKCAIHHAGFVPGSDSIYTLSTDETLSLYELQHPDGEAEEPEPQHFGDMRAKLHCEYVVDVCYGAGGVPFIAAGSHSRQDVVLYPFPSSDITETPWELTGAHREEIVRDVFIDATTSTVFSCGEDGQVKAWKQAESNPSTPSSATQKRQDKKVKDRFNPY